MTAIIRSGKKLGKYLIKRKLDEGGFAAVYAAVDTIEGVNVALKIPFPQYVNKESLEDFRREVRMVSRLQHPHILPLKNAEFVDGHFVMVHPLGEGSLADRLSYRISIALALEFTDQILQGVAFAHEHRIIHCDIKPENLILFPGNRLLLSDFGIAKVAQRTIRGGGTGTVGHIAPEQAMGKPSFASDVFSIGLIAYRMFSGHWPEWPFDWPPDGYQRVRERLHPEMIAWLKRSMELQPRKRYRDAIHMLSAFSKIKNRATGGQRRRRTGSSSRRPSTRRDWKTLRFSQFRKRFGRALATHYQCEKCHGPVSEAMQYCPWCSDSRQVVSGETRFPQICPRCHRGMKLDWNYCAWCYGPGFEADQSREYSDKRYAARCSNPKCQRKDLMPFMRYCPWCRHKVRRKWKLPDTGDCCKSCGWGVVEEFWNHCAWCGADL